MEISFPCMILSHNDFDFFMHETCRIGWWFQDTHGLLVGVHRDERKQTNTIHCIADMAVYP